MNKAFAMNQWNELQVLNSNVRLGKRTFVDVEITHELMFRGQKYGQSVNTLYQAVVEIPPSPAR